MRTATWGEGERVGRSARVPAAAHRATRRTAAPRRGALARLGLGALGVVFGDIGTSPLYALKECFAAPHGVAPTRPHVLGVLSLVFWAITFVVTFKYLLFVMRADNQGEGGIFALLALVRRRTGRALVLVGLFGAALLYGDGVITPAISVLSAVEGLAVAERALQPAVLPLAVAILLALFTVQRRGSGAVGAVFGPVMLLWFACIGAVGLRGIARDPAILGALSPHHALAFLVENGARGYLVLGAVVLAITGGEALYADMGAFGRAPIRAAWFAVALPALVLNYLGQGAMVLQAPGSAANPFFLLVPGWGRYPMIALATAATVIASQALISGASSLTSQAGQLGYAPRFTIRHTSRTEYGQIYLPAVNWALALACVAIVLAFRSSSALASAYGIAVTGTMLITTLLFHRVMVDLWRWPRWRAWPVSAAFLAVDAAFLGANVVKIEDGGWFPLVAAAAVFVLMSTWHAGRVALRARLAQTSPAADDLVRALAAKPPPRVPGTAVFVTWHANGAPPALLHHLRHDKVLHERVILVSVRTVGEPAVRPAERATVHDLGAGIHRVVAHYGFMEHPDVPSLLASLPAGAIPGPPLDGRALDVSYYVGRETVLPDGPARMAGWRKRLFIFMARNAQATNPFRLPPGQVVELGAEVQL